MIPAPLTCSRMVLTYGRFDGLNQRHLRLLHSAAQHGTELIVGCATDGHATTLNRPCQIPFASRRASLEACRFVTRVIPLETLSQVRTDIVNYDVSTVVMHEQFDGLADEVQDIAQILWLSDNHSSKMQATAGDQPELALAG